MVPCSRSRIRAAPVRTTVSVVIWLTRATMAPNQEASPLGLNALRMTTRRGSSGFASVRWMNELTRSIRMFLM